MRVASGGRPKLVLGLCRPLQLLRLGVPTPWKTSDCRWPDPTSLAAFTRPLQIANPRAYARCLTVEIERKFLVSETPDWLSGCRVEDLYRGALAGLVIAEVEFASARSSASFEPPRWIGIELTGDPGHANKNLATRGSPAIAQPDS